MPANQARSREAQARLMKAGEGVFAKKGYDEAHVGDIAAAAQCSIGSFYRRFRDKEALFRALHLQFAYRIERNMERFLSRPERAEQPVYEVLEVLVRNTAQVIERHPGFFRALFQRMLAGAGHIYVPALWAADTASGHRLAAFLRSRREVAVEPLAVPLEEACALGLRSIEAILVQRVLRREMVSQEPFASPFVIERLTRMLAACIAVAAPPERSRPAPLRKRNSDS